MNRESPQAMLLLCSQIHQLIESERELQRAYESVGKLQYRFLGGTDRYQWDRGGAKFQDYDMDSFIDMYKNTSRNIVLLDIYEQKFCPSYKIKIETVNRE